MKVIHQKAPRKFGFLSKLCVYKIRLASSLGSYSHKYETHTDTLCPESLHEEQSTLNQENAVLLMVDGQNSTI